VDDRQDSGWFVLEHRPDGGLRRVRASGRDDATRVRLDDRRESRPPLVAVPRRGVELAAVPEERGHRAHDPGRLFETTEELVDIEAGRLLQRLPAAIDEHEPRTSVAAGD